MSIAKGSKSRVLYAEEASLGVKPASTFHQVNFISESLTETINPIQEDNITTTAMKSSVRAGDKEVSGDVEMDFSFRPAIFEWFRHALGQYLPVVTSVNVPAVFGSTSYSRGNIVSYDGNIYVCSAKGDTDPAITLVPNLREQEQGTALFDWLFASQDVVRKEYVGGTSFLPVGLSVEKQILGMASPIYFLMLGCRIERFLVKVPQQGIVGLVWSLRSKDMQYAFSPFSSTIESQSGEAFAGSDVSASINSLTNVARPIVGLDFSVRNTIPKTQNVGSETRADLRFGGRAVEGSFTIYFEDYFDYYRFWSSQVFNLVVSFIRTPVVLSVELRGLVVTGSSSPVISDDGVLEVDYQFTGGESSGADFRIYSYEGLGAVDTATYLVDESGNRIEDEDGNELVTQ